MNPPRPDPAERPDPPDVPRTVLSRFTMPADDWARDDAARGPRTVDALMWALLAALLAAAGAAVAWYRGDAGAGAASAVILGALAGAAGLAFAAMRKVRRDLHEPLSELYAWALGMCSGDFSTRVPAEGEGAYRKLAFHVNRLSEALERLANDMDDVVWRQTERLREKNASLELLHEVTASIHRLDSVDEILRATSRSMMEMVGARGAMVCVRDAAGGTSVAARIGRCPDGPEPSTDGAGEAARAGTSPPVPGPARAGPDPSAPPPGEVPIRAPQPPPASGDTGVGSRRPASEEVPAGAPEFSASGDAGVGSRLPASEEVPAGAPEFSASGDAGVGSRLPASEETPARAPEPPASGDAGIGGSGAAAGEGGGDASPGERCGSGAGMVEVPLEHKGADLGVIRLFTGSPGRAGSPERHRLLRSVGRHLGMSIAKARTDEESKTLSIVRERAAIAYELHDSLAQTLASLRLQADVLADSLAGAGAAGRVPAELARLRTTLESANVELRELIAGFRAPVDGRDLRTALEEMSARYTAQGAMTVHLQIDGELPELAPGARLQVVRIVGEALANACAHSGGNLARVLVRGEAASVRVLVEDDGEGFSPPPCERASGEHIGLSVMRERARWLGGALVIESEPGEGTRVSLAFPRAGAAAPAPAPPAR